MALPKIWIRVPNPITNLNCFFYTSNFAKQKSLFLSIFFSEMSTKKLTNFDSLPWKTLKCAKNQIRLDIVLKCGQSFRWSQYKSKSEVHQLSSCQTGSNGTPSTQSWIGVMSDIIWLIRQNEEQIQFKTIALNSDIEADNCEEDILKEYFQLDVDLQPLYKVNYKFQMCPI